MIDIQPYMNKLKLSVISMSVVFAVSACSGDNTATEESTAANEPATAVEETAVAETEGTTPESVVDPESEAATESADIVDDAVATPETDSEALAADAGAKLYESNCQVCHAAGLLDAPKYGDTAAWAARLTKDKETLYMHSAKGFNKMPAQAVNGVTEAQVKAAVDYMLASVS